MQQTCPYCGDPDIASDGAKTNKNRSLYTCSNCGMSFFDYQIPGSQNDQTVSGSQDNILSEEETQNLAVSLLQKKGYAEACQAIDDCPSPWQHPLAMNFLRLIGELGKPGILTELNLKLLYADKAEHNFTSVLDVIIDNLRHHIDSLLPKNDPQQLYAAYCGLYEALSALAALPIEYYSESKQTFFGQQIHADPDQKRYHRTDIWIKRAIAAGTLAQSMEALRNDSRYGDKYREMSASLLSKCADYNKKAPSIPFSETMFIDIIAYRITDYFVMNRQETKMRRQFQAKIKDEKSPVELIYQPQDRNTVLFSAYAISILINAIMLFMLLGLLMLFWC